MTHTIRSLITASLFVAATAAYAAAPFSFFVIDNDDPAYAAGSKALNDRRYSDAISSFDKVINAHGSQADAALYWKAYTLNKLRRKDEVIATCNKLRADYSKSSWNKDCASLALATGKITLSQQGDYYIITKDGDAHISAFPAPPTPPSPLAPLAPLPSVEMESAGRGAYVFRTKDRDADPDTEIKILALNSLLRNDPDKAVPEMRTLLTGNASASMKRHVIFSLAQSKSPEAQKTLDDAIRGKMGPDVQRQAISTVPLFQGKRVNDALVEAYKTSSDPKLKESIITGLFISQDAPHLVELARSEKDLQTKRRIVEQLAIMHDKAAQDYMLELLK